MPCSLALCRRSACFALLLGCFCSTIYAQNAQVSGRVTDESGATVGDASLEFVRAATKTKTTTKSAQDGLYSVPSLSPGKYTVTVQYKGFNTFVADNVNVETGGKITYDVTLRVGQQNQSVSVDASGVQINTTDASVSTVVNRQFVENIPLNGRTFQSLISMVPGTTAVPAPQYSVNAGQFSVNGQRTESNYFTVDGVSANTGTTPNRAVGSGAGFSGSGVGNTALGTTQSLVSLDALEEFRALTSTYSAEYGRTPGGQFSFSTRSGTNDVHGSLYDYFRNNALDANNWFNNRIGQPRPALRQNDFGGTFGGPVYIPKLYDGRNRTFFFFSYEGLRLRTPTTRVGSTVPSLSLRQRAPAAMQGFLNAYPLPTENDLGTGVAFYSGTFSVPSTLDTTSIRIDHNFGDRIKVFGRYNDAPSNSVGRGSFVSLQSTTTANVRTGTVGMTAMVTPRLTNDLRYNYTLNSQRASYAFDNIGGAQPWDLTQYPGIGTTGWLWAGFIFGGGDTRNSLVPQQIDQTQINVVDSVAYSIGQHNLKFGVDYRRIATPLSLPDFQTTLYLTNIQQVLNNRSNIQVTRYGGPFKPIFQNFSSFAQDEWKLSRRLNLSLGLRWELNPAPKDYYGNNPYTVDQISNLGTTLVAPRGTALWRTTYTNFAPRIGAAYRLREQTGWETVVRGGFGMFYDTGNTESAAGYGSVGSSTSVFFNAAAFPLTEAQYASIPAPNANTPYAAGVYGGVSAYDPNLKLPFVYQWNTSIEQMLSASQSLTVSYVGSSGQRLLANRTFYPKVLGNANFGVGSGTGTALTLTRNSAVSNYNALQVQFQRRISHGLQFHSAYTWSHSIDEVSTNFSVAQLLRGASDFDIRHNFQFALTYDIPGSYQNRFLSAVLKNWSADTRIFARSSAPVNVTNTAGIDPALGLNLVYQANLVPGQSIYLYDGNYAGGRRINPAAFRAPASGQQGNLGRNALRGFGAAQTDLAVRRNFNITERLHLQARAEAFNLFNNANFGAINTSLNNAGQFGLATGTLNNQLTGLNSLYQIGGPRSLQFALKLSF